MKLTLSTWKGLDGMAIQVHPGGQVIQHSDHSILHIYEPIVNSFFWYILTLLDEFIQYTLEEQPKHLFFTHNGIASNDQKARVTQQTHI